GQMDAYLAWESACAYKAFVMKRRDMKYIVSALQAAKPFLLAQPTDLDHDEFLLNCHDGTYDLSTAARRDFDPGDLITKICNTAPSDEGKGLWDDFLNTIFLGDTELIEYVQKICGLGAIGKVYMEAIIISYGEGANGKSTFWNTIAWALGSYAGGISADALTVGCRRNVKPEIAEVKGKRLLIAAELEEGMRLSTATVKQLCSTDQIKGEKKYKAPFDFVPSHTLVLYTNHLPKVGAMDRGIWRRLIVIPFNATITGKNDIKNYAAYLQKHAGQYVLKWIIEGAQKAIKDNYDPKLPQVVEDAIGRYRSDSNWLGYFVEECCEVGEGLSEKSGDFYTAYRAFCLRMGDYIRDSATFYAAVEQAGYTRFRKSNGRYIGGIRLKSEFAES
ncbi:MAG: DNA primase, partial [Selenomonadaceae bacterium]|nr:DNA primase [Selenomonadaceae bacterium]